MMDSEQQEFERNLAILIRLFKKIRDKGEVPGLGVAGMDDNMRQSMDFLIRNFEMLKNDTSTREAMSQAGLHMAPMIKQLIMSLREQLGDEANDLFDDQPDEVKRIEPVVTDDSRVEVGVFTRRLVQIDQMLAKGNLPDDDVDALLDERLRIIGKLNANAE
jgi:hypothetical protein